METLLRAILGLLTAFFNLFYKQRSIGQQIVLQSKYDSGNGLPTGDLEIEVPDSWADDWTIYIEYPDATLTQAANTEIMKIFAKIECKHGGLPSNHNETMYLFNSIDYINPGGKEQYKRWMQVPIVGGAYHVSGRGAKVTIGMKSTASVPDNTNIAFNIFASKGRPKTRKVAVTRTVQQSTTVNNYFSIPRYAKSFTLEVIDTGSYFDLNNIVDISINTAGNAVLELFDNANTAFQAIAILGTDKLVDATGTVIAPGQKTRTIDLNENAGIIKIGVFADCTVRLVYDIEE